MLRDYLPVVVFFGNCQGTQATHAYALIPTSALTAAASVQPLLIRNCTGNHDVYVAHAGVEFDLNKHLAASHSLHLN